MRTKAVATVSFIILASCIYLLFVFDNVYTGSTDDILTSFDNTNQHHFMPISVTEVARMAEAYVEFVEEVYSPLDSTTSTSDESTRPYTPAGSVTINAAGNSDEYPWFYHQAKSCDCAGCGEWNSWKWGWTSPTYNFTRNGCAVYSLAMICSHLCNKAVTPDEVLVALGATKHVDSKFYQLSTATGCFASEVNIIRRGAVTKLADTYGFNFAEIGTRDEMDKALSEGKLVWAHVGKASHWTNNMHFIAVYGKTDSNGYLAYNSSSTKYYNDPENCDVFWQAKNGPLFAIWKEGG